MTPKAHVKVPERAKPGEVVLIRAKLKHPMETGWREDANGNTVARNRIHTFICTFNDSEVCRGDFDAGVSADPYLAFYYRAHESGTFQFRWLEDGGGIYSAAAAMEVGS